MCALKKEKKKKEKKKKEEIKTRVACKEGMLLIDGKCVRLSYDSETKNTQLVFNEDCPEETQVVYTQIADSLARKKGKLIIGYGKWEKEDTSEESNTNNK